MQSIRLKSRFFSLLPPLRLSACLLLLFFFSQLSGCSKLNCTRLESLLGGRTDLISFSYKITDHLVEGAMPQLIPMHPEMPVLVTTFQDNNDLEKTTSFGRLMQEHVGSRLVQLGYTVREIKVADTLYIEPQSGETILTRDLSKLKTNHEAQALLVGTYSRTNRMLYISTRLINPSNNNIISSSDYRLCMDEDIMAMFNLRFQNNSETPVEDPGQPFLNKFL